MSTIYFDITDLVHFVRRNSRITGIQRVELNILREITTQQSNTKVFGVLRSPDAKYFEVNLEFLRSMGTFVPETFIRHTSTDLSARWPDKMVLRHHLDSYKNKKFLRIIQKIWIYTQALLHPNALVRKGLLPNRETAQNTIHARISAHDVYVMLGTAWERPSSLDFARKHRGSGGRVVQMIHDIVPVVRPEFHVPKVSDAFSRWLKSTSEITTLYLCVSKHTGADLRRYLNDLNREALIAITPLAHEFLGKSRGVDADLPETASLTSKALRPRRFALCVGSIEHRKNGAALIRAWSAAIEQQASEVEDIKLVFVGKRSWLTEAFERELAAANLKRSSIVVLESCTDDELSWLYCNAMLTVFPSLYEGWGLPVGESLWFHTPCLASSSSSIPEVGGDLVRYFCPDSIKDINRALTYALRNPSELEEQRTAIAQSNLRRWSDVARDVYSNLVDHINAPVPAYARSPKKSTPIKATR